MSTTDTDRVLAEIDDVLADKAPLAPAVEDDASAEGEAVEGPREAEDTEECAAEDTQGRQGAQGTERKISTGQAATMLGVARKTIMRLTQSGELRYVVTPSRHRRVYENDVRALLEAEQAAGPTLTSAETATLLGVNKKTVGNWVHSGRLEAVPSVIGTQYRFRETDVHALLEAEQAAGPTLTTAQVAEALGVNPSTVNSWVRSGTLTPVPTGIVSGRYRFREDDIRPLFGERTSR